ncbi:MAG: pheA [Acidimicrobiaceae bacterium]|nr:pheA [Acidimicrobiaceae bacterium]
MSDRLSHWERIAYLGPEGTFTEEALLGEADLASADLMATATIEDAIAAVASGDADAAFVPFENSIEGPISATVDRLIFGEDLLVQREVVLDIHLHLLGLAGTALGEVRQVLSYPPALAQCRDALLDLVPGASRVATSSTADAARVVSEERLRDAAAVAPLVSAKLYGLEVLAPEIEDHDGNQTRFVLVAKDRVPPPSGNDRTLLVCFQQEDRPGSLVEILGTFAARRLNLSRLVSRPTKQALGEYCFVIEAEGHVSDQMLGDCLAELHRILGGLRFLGSYPVSGAHAEVRRAEVDLRRRSAEEWLTEVRTRIWEEPSI